jgi:hypothetical protein
MNIWIFVAQMSDSLLFQFLAVAHFCDLKIARSGVSIKISQKNGFTRSLKGVILD